MSEAEEALEAIRASFTEGQRLLTENLYPEALGVFRDAKKKCLDRRIESPSVYACYAIALDMTARQLWQEDQGKAATLFKDALESIDRAIQLDPVGPSVQSHRVIINAIRAALENSAPTDRDPEALVQLYEMIRCETDVSINLVTLVAKAHTRLGNLETAARMLQAITILSPSKKAWQSLERVARRMGKLELASQCEVEGASVGSESLPLFGVNHSSQMPS